MKTLRISGWAVIFTVTVLLAACASHNAGVVDTSLMSGPDATMAQLDEQKQMLGQKENTVAIRQAWLDEREKQLDEREADLKRQESYLAINQAWLNERETRLAQGTPDLTRKEDMRAFRQTWTGERQIQMAGSGSSQTRAQKDQCYANVFIPAQYRTVAVTKPIEVPKGESLPRLYQTVTEHVKISDERMSKEEILCDSDITPTRVSEIQRSLHRGGYNPGPIDGVVGQQTMASINAFQKDFNLTVANYLTIETVEALKAQF
jgi:lysozyme family protein